MLNSIGFRQDVVDKLDVLRGAKTQAQIDQEKAAREADRQAVLSGTKTPAQVYQEQEARKAAYAQARQEAADEGEELPLDHDTAARIERTAADIEEYEGYIQRKDAEIEKLKKLIAEDDPNTVKSLRVSLSYELSQRQELVDSLDVLRGTKTEEQVEEEQEARKAASEAAYAQAQQDAANKVLNRATVLFGPVRDAEEKLTKARDRLAEERKRRGLPAVTRSDTPKIVNETGEAEMLRFRNRYYDEILRAGLDLQGPNAHVGKAWRCVQFLDEVVSEACRSGADYGQRVLDEVKAFISSSTISTVAKQLTSFATQTDRVTDDLKNGTTRSSSPSPTPSYDRDEGYNKTR